MPSNTTGMSATDIVLIITAITTMLTSVIAAIKANQGKNISQDNNTQLHEAKNKLDIAAVQVTASQDKIDKIHDVTNGEYKTLKDRVAIAESKANTLHGVLLELSDKVTPEILQMARDKVLAKEAISGKRRITDLIDHH